MPVPAAQDRPQQADKSAFLAANRGELGRILREPLDDDQLASLCRFSDQKYFFLDITLFNGRYLEGNASAIIRDFQCVDPLDRPQESQIRALDKLDEKIDIFAALRLSEFLRAPQLRKQPSETVLEDMGLRNGLPDRSVVPALRVVERDAFRTRFFRYRVKRKDLEASLQLKGNLSKPALVERFLGSERPKRFTITTELASRMFQALVAVTGDKKLTLDELFPVNASLRLKQRIAPLAPSQGNVL